MPKIVYEEKIKENNITKNIPVVSQREIIKFRDNKIDQVVEIPKLRIFDKQVPIDVETVNVVEKMKEINIY